MAFCSDQQWGKAGFPRGWLMDLGSDQQERRGGCPWSWLMDFSSDYQKAELDVYGFDWLISFSDRQSGRACCPVHVVHWWISALIDKGQSQLSEWLINEISV
jgi:hypothetical protein